jgi:hypothetical protein
MKDDSAANDYSVGCIVRENRHVLARFIDYYLGLGADCIIIFYDGSPDELPVDFVKSLDTTRVKLTFCDDAYWEKRIGFTTKVLHEKQTPTFFDIQSLCESTWLFITDADEFLIQYIPVKKMLARVSSGVDSFNISPVEAVWGPGDDLNKPFGSTWFRSPFDEGSFVWSLISPLLYGSIKKCFTRNHLGHTSGKHFIRSTAEFDLIGSHRSMRGDISVSIPLSELFPGEKTLEIAHFDAISYSHWREKFGQRISGEVLIPRMRGARRRQLLLIEKSFKNTSQSDLVTHRLFTRFYSLGCFKLAILRLFKKSFKLEIFKGNSNETN